MTSCTCARSWGLHSKDCNLYVPGHELASNQQGSTPALSCMRCGDTDGPFKRDYVGDWFCEGCLPKLTGGAA